MAELNMRKENKLLDGRTNRIRLIFLIAPIYRGSDIPIIQKSI
jgi:hypothetical protein